MVPASSNTLSNMGIHHVALTVANIEKSVAWYKDIFQAEILERYSKKGATIVHLKIGNARLELFEFGTYTEPLPDYRRTLTDDLHVVGTKHVCFEAKDLSERRRELEGKGVIFGSEIETAGFGGKYFFLKDPDGILIELYQA